MKNAVDAADPDAIELSALAEIGPRAVVARDHARALASEDGEALREVADTWARLGDLVAAGDAAAQSTDVHRRQGRQGSALSAAALAEKLASQSGARTPALAIAARPLPLTAREREIVTVFRYERLFDEYLRAALPGLDPLDAVGFAALVTAVHNHVLRQLLRGTKRVPVSVLRRALDDVLRRFGVHPDGDAAAEDDFVVAVFPRRMPVAEVTRRLSDELG